MKTNTLWRVLSCLLALLVLSGCADIPEEIPVTEMPQQEVTVPEPTQIPIWEQTEPEENTPTEIAETEPISSTFRILFIDVGQADAALVECDGEYMLIDGGNKADSSRIYSILKKEAVPKLRMMVATHAHEDHIGGLPGALNYTSADLVLCPVRSYGSEAFEDFTKYAGDITVPQVGDTYPLGSAAVTILGVNSGEDANNSSIVLRIDYGETSFLFTGDAEREAEQVILESGMKLSATVLKVGHHGSDTGTTYPFLREIMPQYAVISAGEGNSYGHPTENTLSRLRDADVQVFRTDMQGDILCVSDGKTVTMTVSRNPDADVLSGPVVTEPPTEAPAEAPAEEDTGRDYVANKNTKKFHYPSCSHAGEIKEKNRWDFHGTRQELIDKGYKPCGVCTP